MSERFVVGTGRCGSTLLSLMLAEHPDVLSVNEFFTGLDWGRRFADESRSGAEVAALVSTPNDVTTSVLARGHDADEIQYPFRPGDRYGRGDAVPWILISTLSRMSDDPDTLFDETMDFLDGIGPAPLAEQYRHLFEWLTEQMGASIWIERSGSSIDYVGDLIDLYPDARIVHIHRDGHEAALSIREHPFYRLAVTLLYGALPDQVDTGDEEAMITAMLEVVPPVELFGRYWSDQLLHGYAALPRVRPEHYFEVRFEDLIENPAPTIDSIADFFDLPRAVGFVERAAGLVRGSPPTRFDALSADDQVALSQACRPGQILVRRAD
jgi:hypothetical protein